MNNQTLKLFCVAITILCFACKSSKSIQAEKPATQINTTVYVQSTQPVFIYKTKNDYSNLVPVLLSDDKSKIVSYPSPTDINTTILPTPLKNGYLFDNKGIFPNVAFLNLTYDDYAKLKDVPSLEKLYALIIDKDPLIELCDCGKRNSFDDIIKQLNQLIEENKLSTKCKKFK